ncbi:MAG: Holliday junction branch migration protein RuvA [Patescibacteria group bacterium]
MIARLEGKVLFRGTRFLIIDTQGVGYKVFTSLESLKLIDPKELSCELFTHLYVRENALELYGFATMAELEFFEVLIGISGVGPKSALNILSVVPLDTLKRAIATGDTTYLTKISGIGKKTAEKIIIELRDKLAGIAGPASDHNTLDAIDALVSLGYSEREARSALKDVSGDAETVDAKIREALRSLGRSTS